jgi:lipid A ethanolaminephosphotransferase
VAKQIELLESLQDRYDSLLLYVSDHGESLGENGVYLHAAPYFMAPPRADARTDDPVDVARVSRTLRHRRGVRARPVRSSRQATTTVYPHRAGRPGSARMIAYDRALDLLAGCRKAW